MSFFQKSIQFLLGMFGYKIQKKINHDLFDELFLNRYKENSKYSTSKIEFFLTLEHSLNYIFSNKIKGDFIECGVFKGANCKFICDYLVSKNINDRLIYLYDTFDGMPESSEVDININSKKNYNLYLKNSKKDNRLSNFYKYESINNVRKNILSSKYDEDKIFFIKGLVENTIPKKMPKEIGLAILDTDYYSSTIHELKHLYPLITNGGVLIIDDYGTWAGVKKAVDEYFIDNKSFRYFIDHKTLVFIKN
mgnify:CR=1 FL=1